MGLSPEERRKIYEEEKARLEAKERRVENGEGASTSLKPNVAGTLCYLGGWVTGIIFLIIERHNRTVRFHAMQAFFTFGVLGIVIAIADNVRRWVALTGPEWFWPFYPGLIAANIVFSVLVAIAVVLWLVMMYQTYHGRLIKLSFFGDVAEKLLDKLDSTTTGESSPKADSVKEAPPTATKAAHPAEPGPDTQLEGNRYSRIAHSVGAIVWSAILLVFFNFFSRYFAVYTREVVDGVSQWHIHSLLTPD